jgi:hypothetical protein
MLLRSRSSTLYLGTGCLALAQVVSKGLTLFAGGSNGRLGQTRRQFSILAIRLVVQQIQVVFVFFQRQEDSDRMALCADDVPRSALAQGTDEIVGRVLDHR